MPSLSSARAANSTYAPASGTPVAIFVGGTAGIGKAIAQAFARHTNGNAHIILVGRNKDAADAILRTFPKPPPPAPAQGPLSGCQCQWKHEFVACDATLMRNVDATTAALRARLPKLNFLVLSTGLFGFRGRDASAEGIDRRLALEYYGRWKFAHDLAPLLQKTCTTAAGDEPTADVARVMSVLSAGVGRPIEGLQADFGLKEGYTTVKAILATSSYNDAMVTSFAERYPEVGFMHVHPGQVRTQIVRKSHWLWKAVYYAVLPVYYPFTVSEDECGELLLHALLSSRPGMSRLNGSGDDIGKKGYNVESEETRRRLWEHTREVIEHALQSG